MFSEAALCGAQLHSHRTDDMNGFIFVLLVLSFLDKQQQQQQHRHGKKKQQFFFR